MSAIAMNLTNKQLAYLHVLKKQNNLSEPEYHDLLRHGANVQSAKELDSEGLNKVLQLMEDLGYEIVRFDPAPDYGNRPGMATSKQIGYIDGLRQEIFGKGSSPKFQHWLENHFNVTHIRFIDRQTASKVIEGLKAMQKSQRNYK